MVQRSDGASQGILDRIMRFFAGARPTRVSVSLSLDMDQEGHHVVSISLLTKEGKIPLADQLQIITQLKKYGVPLIANGKRYILDAKGFEILQSIISQNPLKLSDGRLSFGFSPSVLNYLRRRNVEETKSSQRIEFSEEPPERGAEIDYDPKKGLTIRTGYRYKEKIIPRSQAEVFGKYLKLGDMFYPSATEKDPRIREWMEAEVTTIPIKDIPEFFLRDLILLKSKFKAVLNEGAASIKLNQEAFQPIIIISNDEPGWLDFQVEYKAGEYTLSADLFRKGEKFAKIDDQNWIRVDWTKVDQVERKLEELGAEKGEDGYRISVQQFQSLEEFINNIGGVKSASEEYQRFLEEITDFRYDTQYKLPENIEKDIINSDITLRPYQRSGIQWMNWLFTHYLHGLLADDMGLGKTIQTIVSMRYIYEQTGLKQHSLVICPISVIKHWRNEIERVYPRIYIYEYHGSTRLTSRLRSTFRTTIFLTSYDTAVNDIEELKKIPFLFVVLDEGTKIKNPGTARAQAVKQLNAAHKISLSGTPIENRPAELWSIFDFLMKGHLGSYSAFISRFEKPIIKGDETTSKALSKRISPFILRRMKEDVAKDLPEKIEIRDWCSLTNEQRSLYGQIQDSRVNPIRSKLLRGEYVSYTSIFPIITKLKQVCDHPALITGEADPLLGRSEKFDLVTEKISDINGNGESLVVFSHYLETLNLLEKHLRNEGLDYIRIDGSTRNRQELIDRFNRGKTAAAVCSILACCHGINLLAANHVIHIDRWWNPAIEDQATDRVHRIGQTKTVYVHKIITQGTLEEKIDLLLKRKQGISDKVIGVATAGEKTWTREELLEILQPFKG